MERHSCHLRHDVRHGNNRRANDLRDLVHWRATGSDGTNKRYLHHFQLGKRFRRREQQLGTRRWRRIRRPVAVATRYSSRNPTVTGIRAARTAGNKPPIKPIASAHVSPLHSSSGETLKAKTTWLKFDPRVEAV